MVEKEVNITFIGSDKVVQHIHGVRKNQNIKKNSQDKFLNSKNIIPDNNVYIGINVDDDSVCFTSDQNYANSQTFITTQSELKGSELFSFKSPRPTSFKRISSSTKKNFKQFNIQNKDLANNDSSDEISSLNDDNLDQITKSQVTKKTLSDKKKFADKNEVDTAAIEEFFEEEQLSLKTSDRTLSRLPKLDPLQLEQILSNYMFPYIEESQDLCSSYVKYFTEWMINMKYGSNILLYGLGSKLNILEKFANDILSDYHLIIVNGFFPSLTLKSIISCICDLIGISSSNMTSTQIWDSIQKHLEKNDIDLFLVIHNIDGPALRNEKIQNDLSYLAEIQKVHIIASFDHINAPLLWDQTKLNRFSFLWYNLTTFENYVRETSYESSLLISGSGALQLTSLSHILASLTENAKKIFIMLAKNQVESSTDANFQGYAFEDLYMKCREEFLVNSETTLRAQLSEFIDHKLVRLKKGLDGVELVNIMLDDSNLTIFLQNQDI